jgi:hypothetical protein
LHGSIDLVDGIEQENFPELEILKKKEIKRKSLD